MNGEGAIAAQGEGAQLIEKAAGEILQVIDLFTDEEDNRDQIIEIIQELAEAGGAAYQLKKGFADDQMSAVGAHLALAIAMGLIGRFIPLPSAIGVEE